MDPITLSTATDRQSITVGTCNLSSEVSALCFAFLAEEASRSTEFSRLASSNILQQQHTNQVTGYRDDKETENRHGC